MKKKLMSLVMGICMIFIGMFSLSGCSVVRNNDVLKNQETSIKVGDTSLTRADIVNAFYTYYQNNNSYFAYYDEETIEDSFYSYAIIKEIIEQKAFDYLYDAETNPDGKLIYTEEDEKEVIKNTYNYVLSQILTKEKAIYALAGYEEADYPIWLRTEEEKEEDKLFEAYKSSRPEIEPKDEEDAWPKSTEDEIKDKVEELEKFIFEYVESTDEDGEDVRKAIDETDYIVGARNQARAEYIEGLVSNAKAAGTDTTISVVLENELVRVYEAYYNTKVQSLFQKYFLEEYLTDTVNGDKVSLSDKAIAKAYLEKYYSDVQVYQVENNYISTITSSDGVSLVFYNYNGRNYFFTVQHILVQYDDYMSAEIKKIPGYSASSDYDSIISEPYKKERFEKTEAYKNAMLTNINKDVKEQFGNGLEVKGNYYYFDETLEGDKDNNFGYIKLFPVEVDGKITYRKVEGDANSVVAEEDVLYMATAEEIVECYNANVYNWKNILNSYMLADAKGKADIKGEYNEEVLYIFETIDNMLQFNASKEEILNKIASLLFVELQWVYSSDSLGNELSNKMGYVVSNYPDENGSWVADFAVGARELLARINESNGTIDNSVVDADSMILSDYGYHIIKIENVFEAGSSLVDMESLQNEVNLESAEFVEELVNLLKQTYVCTSSNQTVYDYFYDQIYTELVGTADASGTYYTKLQYEWYSDYMEADKIEIVNRLSYEELMDAINQ